jgi:hypothetical protein
MVESLQARLPHLYIRVVLNIATCYVRAHTSLHGLIPKVPTCLVPYGRNPDLKASQGKPSSLTCHAPTWQRFSFQQRARRSIVCGSTDRLSKISSAGWLRKRTKLADTSKQFLGPTVVGELHKKCQRSHRAHSTVTAKMHQIADMSINCGVLSGVEFSIDQLCQHYPFSKNLPHNAQIAPAPALVQ